MALDDPDLELLWDEIAKGQQTIAASERSGTGKRGQSWWPAVPISAILPSATRISNSSFSFLAQSGILRLLWPRRVPLPDHGFIRFLFFQWIFRFLGQQILNDHFHIKIQAEHTDGSILQNNLRTVYF
jgi:hypothetical protein